ncbi:O-antigen translocase [Marixanthomonas spongiae]|uniref:O-antigen flippase n=1 Tax=Marixanthomonas spongiae TaxID=2174845 RepID=A0A2U0I5A3_9FLAO|nr:O-antigen translocase [Marixanthomonas spongiae]PVW16287.1 O-antigen flippase [Marixanthomonas spongiae]
MRVPKFIRDNLLLKMTSLNAGVIGLRLVISLFVQRMLAQLVGETGIAKIGQLRNLLQLLTSIGSAGIFTGVVKYVSEHRDDKEQLRKLFSTSFVFVLLGTMLSFMVLFFGAGYLSQLIFDSLEYAYLIKLTSVIVPFIALERLFNGVINGLSKYKQFAKISIVSYVISTGLLVLFLFQYNIDGALVAIAITPVIQLIILLLVFFKVLREYVQFSELSLKIPLAKSLLAFSLMSFFSTVLLNYVEIDIRTMIKNRITEADAGIWTAMTNISKNYLVFSNAIFSLYVLPKFSGIHTQKGFKRELFHIYKTLLPLFGIGMVVVYFAKEYIVALIYPGFTEMVPLFKWQLLGDFIRLASVVVAHQFLAKKLVRSFIFTEVFSLALFFGLARYFVTYYGVEGVVMAHFIRYIIYFFVVLFLVFRYFKKQKAKH